MKRSQRRRSTFWRLLLVTLFGLPIITPLLRWTAVPCTHDGHLHYHRIAAMRYAWENGIAFTRWLPDLAFGYGYPFFVYREPVPLYLGLIPHLMGLPLPAASNLVYILSILAGGWFMFLWVRDVLGDRAGLVAAVAYMAAPYVLVDALVRGNMPESLALPLFPFLLWLGRRWLLAGTAGTFLFSTLGLAFFSLSHNISLLLFTPMFLVYLLLIGRLRRLDWKTIALRLSLLFGLGLGATVFYSGGALLEMGQVTLQQSTVTRNNDFHFNFTSPDEIFAPVPPEDPALVNPPLPFRLGWVPVALAILGLVSLAWQKKEIGDWRLEISGDQSPILRQAQDRFSNPSTGSGQVLQSLEQRWHIGLMGLATAVFLFMSLPASLPVWETLPLIDFVQFPWRFVGRAALPVAFLAGVPFASLRVCEFASLRVSSNKRHTSRITYYVLRITYYAALTLLLLETFPNLYPDICAEEPFPTIHTVHAYERETGLVGVDPEGSYFPRTVAQRPAGSPLESDYQAGRPPQRFDVTVLPEGTVVNSVEYGRLAATIQLNSPEPFTARYLTFAFPGWTAAVDGRSTPITPSSPEGLITFPVPAGEHTLTIRWQSTPLRTALLGVSIVALAGVVATAVVLAVNQLSVISDQYSVISDQYSVISDQYSVISDQYSVIRNHRLLNTEHWSLNTGHCPLNTGHCPLNTAHWLLGLGVALLAFKLLAVDRIETPLRRTAPPPVVHTAALPAGELRFEGYNLSQDTVAAGATFDIHMAWTAVAPPAADYQSNVWLAGPEGLTWSVKETERPRLYEDAPRTSSWQAGQWGWDSREVRVLSGAPPGQYDIVLTLFDLATLQPLTINRSDGSVVGPTAVTGQITVTTPREPAVFAPQFSLQTTVAGLTLLGYDQDRTEAAPGDLVLLTLFWEKPANPPGALSVFKLHLQDENEEIQQTWAIPPVRADYPPGEWLPGERLRGQHRLRLPASLDSGIYRFVLNSTPLGTLAITAPERIFTQPAAGTAVHADFMDSNATTLTTLTGYTLEPATCHLPLATCNLTLIWQAQTELHTSYHVFIHLVDETGQIVTQSDGQPANWTRPTTGWSPGEYIIDPHQLTLPDALPDGPLTLRIGLYDPDTGKRLKIGTAEFVTLPFR